MLAVIPFVALCSVAEPIEALETYTKRAQAAIARCIPSWFKIHQGQIKEALKGESRPVLVRVEIDAQGALKGQSLLQSSGTNALDDRGRILILTTEPLPPPPAPLLDEQQGLPCVVRVAFRRGRRRLEPTVAIGCLPREGAVGSVAGLLQAELKASDAGAALLAGWLLEGMGQREQAMRAYRRSLQALVDWDLPARSLGMALLEAKQIPEAVKYLKLYVRANAPTANVDTMRANIAGYEKMQAARLAEANRVRDRLSQKDIVAGIHKGYPLLEPCLERARVKRALAVGVDTLVLGWRITKDGTAVHARLVEPKSLLMSSHAECIERAVGKWRFPRYSAGSVVAVKGVPIKVRGSPPPTPAPASSVASASMAVQPQHNEPINEPTFSQCERSPDEIGAYVRVRLRRLNACVEAERRRAPRARLPDALPVSFVVDADGPIRDVSIEHRAYRDGPLLKCAAAALAGAFGPSGGTDCPAEFEIDLRAVPSQR